MVAHCVEILGAHVATPNGSAHRWRPLRGSRIAEARCGAAIRWSALFGVACRAPTCTSTVIGTERLGCKSAQSCLSFNLRSDPDTELQDPLKLLRSVKPAIIVADWMSRKVVAHLVLAAERMREDMVSLPFSVDEAAADVTATGCLSENLLSFRAGQRLSHHLFAEFELSVPPRPLQ